jgi:hypothetical protein
MAVVYQHIRLDNNEVFYVGIGKSQKRAYDKRGYRSIYWRNIAKKGFIVEILYDNLSWEEACEKEKELIKKYGRKQLNEGTLVNMTDGGDGGSGMILSEETREKIRQFQLSMNKKGKPGRVQSEEIKDKIRNTLKGTKRPKDVVEKLKKPKLNKENYSYPKSKIKCPYCNFECQPANAYRWHFDNCKMK